MKIRIAALLAIALAAPAYAGLTFDAANDAAADAWNAAAEATVADTSDELANEAIQAGGQTLRFKTVQFTNHKGKPCTAPCAAADGHAQPLFISLHGGGGGPAEGNDEQWENQIALASTYRPTEGIYLAPRAPTNEWDCWHGAGVDPLLERLIRALVAAGTVDPERVYLMGYSAGGDGVYALAPRMADRFAAASMMAGHPNGISLVSLRNLPFSIQVGALDDAYDRAKVAAEYGAKLDALQAEDEDGYQHFTEIHAGKGHWMDGEDAKAVPWMEGFTRTTAPDRIVWRQSGVIHRHFYWLGIPAGQGADGDEIVATSDGQTITLDGPSGRTVLVRLNDDLVDLDQPVQIETQDGAVLFNAVAPRSQNVIDQTIAEFGDYTMIYSAEVAVKLP
ncbi:hypothetical protein sos41_32010 [Alphaproteobacteria bacterium SO-S41]|nr:hypothetical protein sos41_32010 [Alphaproteobacteria bacterium SO-S41]